MLSVNPLGSWIFEQIGLSQYLLSSFLTWGAFGLQWRLASESQPFEEAELAFLNTCILPERSALPEFDS